VRVQRAEGHIWFFLVSLLVSDFASWAQKVGPMVVLMLCGGGGVREACISLSRGRYASWLMQCCGLFFVFVFCFFLSLRKSKKSKKYRNKTPNEKGNANR